MINAQKNATVMYTSTKPTVYPPEDIVYVQYDSPDNPPINKKNVTNCDKCPDIYYPVCGTNDVTYKNECILECSAQPNVYIKRYGICLYY